MNSKLFVTIFIFLICLFFYWSFFGPVGGTKETLFIVPQKQDAFDVIGKLYEGKHIKSSTVFTFFKNIFLLHISIKPGGYSLHGGMNAWDVLNKLNGEPDLIWVSWSSCIRKEQVGEILGAALGWDNEEMNTWNTISTNKKPEYVEGVYYPDTYLIPRNEKPDKVADRLIARFNEKFAPYADKYIEANIRWVTGIKIGSLIAREAAGREDMHLISGIIWNRLNIGMPLQIDATMQYTQGKNNDGMWWGSINIKEKQSDSPYNSYLYKGLPPTPICSPNIEYIEAALNPSETECLFYLHDSQQQIYCAKDYEGHLENIEKYLN